MAPRNPATHPPSFVELAGVQKRRFVFWSINAKSSLETFPYGFTVKSNSHPAIAKRNDGSAFDFCFTAIPAAGTAAAKVPRNDLRLGCNMANLPRLHIITTL